MAEIEVRDICKCWDEGIAESLPEIAYYVKTWHVLTHLILSTT